MKIPFYWPQLQKWVSEDGEDSELLLSQTVVSFGLSGAAFICSLHPLYILFLEQIRRISQPNLRIFYHAYFDLFIVFQ